MPAPTPPTNPPAVHGKEGVICVSKSGAGSPVPVALVTDWTLNMSRDTVETTALGNSNKTYVAGLKNLEGTFTAQFDKTSDDLFEAADSPDGCLMEIWPSTLSAACFAGPVWLDVSLKGGVSAVVGIDATFKANGNWTRTPWGVAATGATLAAGEAATWVPAGAVPRANLAAMTGITATPATSWAGGDHVVLLDNSHAYWNGTAWIAGNAP